MIESATSYNAQTQSPASPHRVLKMVKNERMGGFVPAWVDASSEKDLVQNALNGADKKTSSFEEALSYQSAAPEPGSSNEEEFGFGDLLDMINPLQHIPVVNTLYRELTGDTIRPIGKIIGGAVFGGPMGAAGALANSVIEYETGQDIASNAYSLLTGRGMKSAHEKVFDVAQKDNKTVTTQDLPGSLLSFADLGNRNGMSIERKAIAGGRTAGTMSVETVQKAVEQIQSLQAREPITQVTFDSPFADEEK